MAPPTAPAGLANSGRNVKCGRGSSARGGIARRTAGGGRRTQEVQNNLFVAVGSQIQRHLLRIGTLLTSADGELFPSAAGWIEVDGDLLDTGASAACALAITGALANVEDNLGASRRGRGGIDLIPKCRFEIGELRLGACQVSRLQSLTYGSEILLALGTREWVAIGERSILAQLGYGLKGRLSTGEFSCLMPSRAAADRPAGSGNIAGSLNYWKRLLST